MKKMDFERYRKYPSMSLKDRTWPDKTITCAPIWCSVDLRDGNQALDVPMSVDEKMAFFDLLIEMGFKEIEVGFPSASETEFRFVRRLIEEGRIPDDVTIQVLTQAREHLIQRTFESLKGAKQAIVHLYNSTSTAQREKVFRMDKEKIKEIAVDGARIMQGLKEEGPCPGIRFEYTPESFTGTEPDYALDVCEAVMNIWKPDQKNKAIINLPATVEMSTPNVYADTIEWFCRQVKKRDSVIISVHTHNDRGTAVAAAELAVMAGADRVEGSIFGNGERSGNMDILTMALNIFSQGIDPSLDITDINKVKKVYTQCTRMEVHPRHPYAGELVYTAFSGSHQDAISKGMKVQGESALWDVPYLPIDPKDVGRTYEAIIRINSQSGKGGVSYVMEQEYGIEIPKWMQPDFGRIVQALADKSGCELTSRDIHDCFVKSYLSEDAALYFCKGHIETDEGSSENLTRIRAFIKNGKEDVSFCGEGNGPVDGFVKGLKKSLGRDFALENYAEHALAHGSDSIAMAYMEIRDQDGKHFFGAGKDANISIASMKAVLSAVNRMGD